MTLLEDFQKDLLGGIVSVLDVAQDAIAGPMDAIPIAFVQLGQS